MEHLHNQGRGGRNHNRNITLTEMHHYGAGGAGSSLAGSVKRYNNHNRAKSTLQAGASTYESSFTPTGG